MPDQRVFNLHSTIELPRDDLPELLDEIDLPPEIDSLSVEDRDGVLIIKSEPTSDDISTYTPTANLKATVEQRPESEVLGTTNDGLWSPPEEDDEQTKKVETVGFKGYGESVLYNTTLQYPMFRVLYQLALESHSGTLTAIILTDDGLQPVSIVDGEEQHAEINISSEPITDEEPPSWRANDLI